MEIATLLMIKMFGTYYGLKNTFLHILSHILRDIRSYIHMKAARSGAMAFTNNTYTQKCARLRKKCEYHLKFEPIFLERNCPGLHALYSVSLIQIASDSLASE